MKRQHAAFFLELAEMAAPYVMSEVRLDWLERLDLDHDNLRVAFTWGAGTPGEQGTVLRLAAALGQFWFHRGYVGEGRDCVRHALTEVASLADDPVPRVPVDTQAKILYAAAALAWIQGNDADARSFIEKSVACYRTVGAPHQVAYALLGLGVVLLAQELPHQALPHFQEAFRLCPAEKNRWDSAYTLRGLGDAMWLAGDRDTAHTMYHDSLALFRDVHDGWGEAFTLYALGNATLVDGDVASAHASLTASTILFRDGGSRWDLAWVLIALGFAEVQRGEYAAATQACMESLLTWRDLSTVSGLRASLAGLVVVATAQGRFAEAARLSGVAAPLDHGRGPYFAITYHAARPLFDQAMAAVQASMTPETFHRAQADGRALPLAQTVSDVVTSWSRSP